MASDGVRYEFVGRDHATEPIFEPRVVEENLQTGVLVLLQAVRFLFSKTISRVIQVDEIHEAVRDLERQPLFVVVGDARK